MGGEKNSAGRLGRGNDAAACRPGLARPPRPALRVSVVAFALEWDEESRLDLLGLWRPVLVRRSRARPGQRLQRLEHLRPAGARPDLGARPGAGCDRRSIDRLATCSSRRIQIDDPEDGHRRLPWISWRGAWRSPRRSTPWTRNWLISTAVSTRSSVCAWRGNRPRRWNTCSPAFWRTAWSTRRGSSSRKGSRRGTNRLYWYGT